MLVTCPECGAKISEEADPCPKCGLPHAGKKSNEYWVRYAGEFEVEFSPDAPPCCGQCRHQIVGRRKVKREVKQKDNEYALIESVKCPNCGTVLENYHSWWTHSALWPQ